MQYTPHYKPNQLICGSGKTAIITGWTVKQSLAKHLQPEEFAVIGNLYSATRGINPLVRNLIANPQVRFLVILNATKEDKNSGSCQCLKDFFAQGFQAGKTDTGRDCWLINSPIKGYIDPEIPPEILTKLRHGLQWAEVRCIKDAISQVKDYQQIATTAEPWGEPLIFPEIESLPTLYPGPRYGHRIEGKTIAETWVKILHRIKTTGAIRATGYDGQWQELINLMAIVTDEPQDFYFPEPNYLPIDREFIQEYIAQILDDSPHREGVKYTYGQRLRSWFGQDQIEQVIKKLITEIDAASAVMSLWDVRDHERGGSPCLNHIWVRVLGGELSLTATLRSNDMFAAWPANAMGLRALQSHILEQINRNSSHNLKLGPLLTISQSAHIYDDTWENVDQLLANQYQNLSQKRDFFDPSGNFLIEIDGQEISLKHLTPGSGEIVATYLGKNPLKLVREIYAALPAISGEHIGYLGIELQKAYQCLQSGQTYRQDQ